MIGFDEALSVIARLQREDLTVWIERRWVVPRRRGDEYLFSDVDVARIALIRELRHELQLDDDTVPLVLSLLDQVYDLRRGLRGLGDAIARQPSDVRESIWAELRRLHDERA